MIYENTYATIYENLGNPPLLMKDKRKKLTKLIFNAR